MTRQPTPTWQTTTATTADDTAARVQVNPGQTAGSDHHEQPPFLTLTITKQVTGGATPRDFPSRPRSPARPSPPQCLCDEGEGAALTEAASRCATRGSSHLGHRPRGYLHRDRDRQHRYETSFDLDGSVEVGTSAGGTLGAQSATLTCVNNRTAHRPRDGRTRPRQSGCCSAPCWPACAAARGRDLWSRRPGAGQPGRISGSFLCGPGRWPRCWSCCSASCSGYTSPWYPCTPILSPQHASCFTGCPQLHEQEVVVFCQDGQRRTRRVTGRGGD